MDELSPASAKTTISWFEEGSPSRLIGLLCLGIITIYGSTHIGTAAFYLSFQKQLLDASRSSVVWAQPAKAGDRTADWKTRNVGDITLTLPPGELESFEEEAPNYRAIFSDGRVLYQILPAGFLSRLYEIESEKLEGQKESRTDAEVLSLISRAHPEEYRSDWGADERSRYATRILCKRLLWEDREVTRFELAEDSKRGEAVALIEYAGGDSKVVFAGARFGLVINLRGNFPEAWKSSARNWRASVTKGASAP